MAHKVPRRTHSERGAIMRAPSVEVRVGGEGIGFKTTNYKGIIRVVTMCHEIKPGEIVASVGSFPGGVTEENVAEDLFLGESSKARVRARSAALALCSMGAKVAIVHAGAEGSALAYAGKTVFVPQVQIKVSSTLGAGDSLAAGFILKAEE